MNLRRFQFGIINRILGTRRSFSNVEKETIKHMFGDCEHVEYFWEILVLLWEDNNYCQTYKHSKNLILNTSDTFCGNPKIDGHLNKIILWGKINIYLWLNVKEPCHHLSLV